MHVATGSGQTRILGIWIFRYLGVWGFRVFRAKMNTKLSEVFPWSSDRSLEGKLVLLLDEHIPGSSHTAEFLLTSLLLKYLTPRSVPTNVLLLLCNHPLGHYESIMRKNVSILTYCLLCSLTADQCLQYIDPRQCLASGQLTVINLHAMEADKPPATDKMDLDYCWEELERWQEQGMRFPGLRGEEAPFVLLVDDLDILELIAPAVDVARRFVVKAIKMLSKQQVRDLPRYPILC